ncbi:MAG: LysR family transcriptional regulator [Myxococcales bacterium]|nr:LysR family transcriptional regulator [Myxococcales bacterium]
MDLAHLRYFREIARLGSMTAAARALGLSQPTLSIAMRNLEEELGATLLQRHRGGTSLTAAGDELLHHADEVFALLDRATAAITGLHRDLVGQFVLGCHESLGAYFLPRLLPTVLRDAPKISLSLRNASSAKVFAAVVEREVDFGLVVNPHLHPDLVMIPLFNDAVDFFVRGDGPAPPREATYTLAGCATTDLEEAHARVREGPLIFAGRVQQCSELLDQLAERNAVPSRLLSCGDFELVKSLTLAGVGVGMLPRRIAAYGREGALRRLHPELPLFADEIVLVYRGDLPKTRAAAFLKDAIVQASSEMPDVSAPRRPRARASS